MLTARLWLRRVMLFACFSSFFGEIPKRRGLGGEGLIAHADKAHVHIKLLNKRDIYDITVRKQAYADLPEKRHGTVLLDKIHETCLPRSGGKYFRLYSVSAAEVNIVLIHPSFGSQKDEGLAGNLLY